MSGRPAGKPRLRAALLLPMALSAAASLATGAAPDNFTAEYRLVRNGIGIAATETRFATRGDGAFLYQSATRATGIAAIFLRDHIREMGVVEWSDGGVRSLAYEYKRENGKRNEFVKLAFDWAGSTVTNMVEGQTWNLAVPPNTVDRLTVQLALMHDLQQELQQMEYTVADDGELKEYRFKVIGKESLETPAGMFDTVRVERIRDNQRRTTVLWCAPRLQYLPVRIDQVERGEVYSTVLTAFDTTAAEK